MPSLSTKKKFVIIFIIFTSLPILALLLGAETFALIIAVSLGAGADIISLVLFLRGNNNESKPSEDVHEFTEVAVTDKRKYLKNKRKAIADFLLYYYDLKGEVGSPIFRTTDGNLIQHPFFTMGNWGATAAPIKFKLNLDPQFGNESYLPENYDEIVRERQQEAEKKEKVFIDRKTYRLLDISTSIILENEEQVNQIELQMNMSSYARFVLTCREASRELNEEMDRRKAFVERYHEKTEPECLQEFEDIRSKLVQRMRWAPDSKTFAGGLLNRSGKLGIDMVLIFNDGEGYKCLIQERSDMVLEQPGAYGVVPAGTFQPPYKKDSDSAYWLEHCSLETNVFRELYEEVLGGTPGESMGEDDDIPHSMMMQYPPLVAFETLRQEKKAGIFFTGLGFSLLHTGPGIIGFIVIKDPSFYKKFYDKYFKRNWESDKIKPVEFSRECLEPYMSRGDIMGCAATALIQALIHFKSYLDKYLPG